MSTDQPPAGLARHGVRDAGVDEARLFDAGDDFDGMPQRLARALEERLLALRARATRWCRRRARCRACMSRRRCPNRSRQASARAARPCRCRPFCLEPGAEPHHLAQAIEDDELAVRVTRDHHVETVGTEIDRRENVRDGLRGAPRQRSGATAAEGHDGVRIMTVHNAKGLEFGVVAVPDLARSLLAGGRAPLLAVGREEEPRVGLQLRRLGTARDQPLRLRRALEEARERDSEEGLRLFHVAATRAKRRLILSGVVKPEPGKETKPSTPASSAWSTRWGSRATPTRPCRWRRPSPDLDLRLRSEGQRSQCAPTSPRLSVPRSFGRCASAGRASARWEKGRHPWSRAIRR